MPTTAAYPLWEPSLPFPPHDEMEDLDIITQVAVERARPGGFHYLHESAIAWHRGALYLGWANHPTHEVNVREECLRGSRSTDGGFTWEPARAWATPGPDGAAESYNHPVLVARDDGLWGFFTRWQAEQPATEAFLLDDASGHWQRRGVVVPGFLPFRPPMRLPDGNWIMAGEEGWYEAAVAISRGDDFTAWDLVRIPRPEAINLQFPETTLMTRADGSLLAICRPHKLGSAPVAESRDGGRNWTSLRLSNFPLGDSQPWCGRLSSGQHYLVTASHEVGRTLMSIAVTAPGGDRFVRVWKLRHQQWPKVRLFGGWGGGSRVGHQTEWSYPAAVEHEGQLFVSCTQGKEDCALSIIPVRVLAV